MNRRRVFCLSVTNVADHVRRVLHSRNIPELLSGHPTIFEKTSLCPSSAVTDLTPDTLAVQVFKIESYGHQHYRLWAGQLQNCNPGLGFWVLGCEGYRVTAFGVILYMVGSLSP